jgi:hypothetical protein
MIATMATNSTVSESDVSDATETWLQGNDPEGVAFELRSLSNLRACWYQICFYVRFCKQRSELSRTRKELLT